MIAHCTDQVPLYLGVSLVWFMVAMVVILGLMVWTTRSGR
jgi:hypothetical protein